METLENSYFATIRKSKYSFPKSNRFPEIKSECNNDFYDNSSRLKPRATSFGFGSKYDFFKQPRHDKMPSPFDYRIQGSLNATKGQSFGLGRNDVVTNNYINPEQFKQTPKLNQYANASFLVLKEKSPVFRLRPRHSEGCFHSSNNNPDPTKYNPVDTFYSRRRRSSQFVFGSAKRFDYTIKDDHNGIRGPAKYTLSPLDSKNPCMIPRAKRQTFATEQQKKSISPGPKYYVK